MAAEARMRWNPRLTFWCEGEASVPASLLIESAQLFLSDVNSSRSVQS